MKKLSGLLLMSFCLFGCEQEIENPIASSSMPVVHCLLDVDDSIHYLRLGKTFSGPGFESMIRNEDSLYYHDARVFFDFYRENDRIKSIELIKTDTLERDPGIFPNTPFQIYYTREPIQPDTILIRIEIPEANRYAKGVLVVRGRPSFSIPNPKQIKQLDFYEDVSVAIKWDGYEHVRETTIRLWYLETQINRTDTCFLDWTYDLLTYPYSNLSNALGFVGSRAKGGMYGFTLDQEFLDTLVLSARTQRLKFIKFD